MKRLIIDLKDDDANNLLAQANDFDLVKDKEYMVFPNLRNGNNSGVRARIIDQGYTIANLEEKLASIKGAFEELKMGGITQQMMRAYIMQKYRINATDYDRVFNGITEFFSQLN